MCRQAVEGQEEAKFEITHDATVIALHQEHDCSDESTSHDEQ